MASKRFVSTLFWDDDKLSDLSANEKYMMLYFMTAPDSNLCGYYQCTLKTISNDTGLTKDESRKAIAGLSSVGRIVFDSGLIFVPNMHKWQRAFSQNSFEDHCRKVNEDLCKPSNSAYDSFYRQFSKEIESSMKRSNSRKSNKVNDENLLSVTTTGLSGNSSVGDRRKEIGNRDSISLESAENLSLTHSHGFTLKEVALEFHVQGIINSEEPQKLYDHYTAIGWVRNGSPIVELKSVVRGWIRRMKEFEVKGRVNGNGKVSKPTTEEEHKAGW